MHRAFIASNDLPWCASVDDMQALSEMDEAGLRIVKRLATTLHEANQLLRMARDTRIPWGVSGTVSDLAKAVDAHLSSI
jgi:hypothetical protein